MKFENMSEDMKSTEVEHHLQNCAEIFSRLSSRIPKNLQFVAQAIHLELCDVMCFSSDAANTFDKEEKMKCLIDMKYKMQKVYKRTHYLVLTRSITIGQGNEFVDELKESYKQTCKWITSTRRSAS